MDYFERAKRLEEIPLLKAEYEKFKIKDKEWFEQQEKERVSDDNLFFRYSGINPCFDTVKCLAIVIPETVVVCARLHDLMLFKD